MAVCLLAGPVVLAGCQTAPSTPPAPAAPTPAAPATPVAPPPPPPPPPPPRIGLALGGGAARGFAHIGVIQVLEEAGIRPDLVAGTSAGSLVAALWASGHDGAALARLGASMAESAIADWGFPGRGLLRGDALARYVRDQTGGRTIERMPRVLGIVATDLDSGEAVLFRRGDTGLAVRASSAVPAVFTPVGIGGREYVDGGLVAPVPVSQARQMGAELVIAVDIGEAPQGQPTGDPFRLLLQTFSIMGRSLSRHELRGADVVIRPALDGVPGTDFAARHRAIAAGRDAALAALPALRARLAAFRRVEP
ncbi:patatin-like phospholipase family protein [Rubrivivax albus]|uniref:Patatin-like phospholipase family protein n=1 Tax=Rubrivivax albus TaxID=2499835 RepID=A0A3S2WXT6_9BURK|nr:patatin-like phospholipase family protein [Rubrivivax albus]RVT48572.1 patatin-like phospholipase family protein [Rubrivivax albus]